jgi:hypothetical protein
MPTGGLGVYTGPDVRGTMASKLGEILVQDGLITQEQLELGLERQLVTGVRIGSALVQLEAVKLDTIGTCLSIQHGVPCATPADLAAINDEVLAVVPPELCAEHVVIPFRFAEGTVHLAMRDPLRHLAGEISFALRRRVAPYVVPELRIMYLLERYLGLSRDPRFLREPSPASVPNERRRHLTPTVTPGAGVVFEAQEGGELELVTLDQYSFADRAVEEDDFDLPIHVEEPVEATRRVDVVLDRLRAAENSEAIARLLVEPVVEATQVAILFWVRGGHAVAGHAHGVTASPDKLQRMVISLESPSLLGEAFQRAGILRGSAAKDPLQREIAEYLGLSAPGEVLVAPVRLHDQVVNLLCIWTGAGERFPDDALQTLMELVQGAAAAYRALAERTKRQQ